MCRPVWNNEICICWDVSKQGDDATMRVNWRSPWNVRNEGPSWATTQSLDGEAALGYVGRRIRGDFDQNPPYRATTHVVRHFPGVFVQHATVSPEEPVEVQGAAGEEQD